MALLASHLSVIKQFKLSEHLEEAKERISTLLCPALYLLDHWLGAQGDPAAPGSDTELVTQNVERVRHDWCALLGAEIAEQSKSSLSDMLAIILESQQPPKSPSLLTPAEEGGAPARNRFRLPRNRDHIDQQVDLALAQSYRQALASMEERNSAGAEKC